MSKVRLLYIVVTIYGIIAVTASVGLMLLGNNYRQHGHRQLYQITRTAVVVLIFPLLIYGLAWIDALFIEPNWIDVRAVDVHSPRFPPGLLNVKIVQVSDLHIERVGFREKKLIEIMARLQPDLILITGDYVNDLDGIEPALAVVGKMRARYGVYAVLGNIDYHVTEEELLVQQLKDVGVIPLLYGHEVLDFGPDGRIQLIGLSYRYGFLAQRRVTKYLDKAVEGLDKRLPIIFMTHDPDLVELPSIKQLRPDLMVAGHTHGGQFGIRFIRRFSEYAERSRYMAGLFDVDGIQLYVNRGLGMKTRNIRFFCRPEVTVFRLSSSPQ